MTTLQFNVEGMTCGKCSSRAENAILELGDFPRVEVDHETNSATVDLGDDSGQDHEALAAAITAALTEIGYPAERSNEEHAESAPPDNDDEAQPTTLTFDVEGMTCGKCSSRVENAILELGDFRRVEVDHDQDRAVVELDAADDLDVDALAAKIAEAVGDVGYPAKLKIGATDSADPVPDSADPVPDSADPVPDSADQVPDSADPVPDSADPVPDSADPVPDSADPVPDSVAEKATADDGAEVRFDVGGMTCASCVASVEHALEDVEGVAGVRVNFATERASVRLGKDRADDSDIERLKKAIEGVGYEVRDVEAPTADASAVAQAPAPAEQQRSRMSERREEEAREWKQRWVTGLVLTVPILFMQMGPMWFDFMLSGTAEAWRLGLLGYLTTIVFAYVGKPYLEGAWKNLKHFRANMDTLIAMGSSVAWGFSMVVAVAALFGTTIAEGEVYFDGAAMILTLISVGKWLEARAKGKAGAAIEALLDLAASTARVRRGSEWVEVPVAQLQHGDEMLVKPGEKIPTDGVVAEGRADVDESMLTGESVPVTREEGDEVIGSTINTDGRLVVRATRVGGETALAQIIELVERAQESKADIQRLADRVSSVFVPVIIVIAIITFAAWLIWGASLATAVLPAVAVLIVACPCALGLATPTAIMVGTGKGANMGILIRDAQALEQARDLNAVVFDKTGTLTTGQMGVTDVRSRIMEEEFLRLGASLEAPSEHPIAEAIVRHAEEAGIELEEVDEFRSVAGDGVEAVIGGRELRIGKPSWILGDDEAKHTDEILSMQKDGKTVVALAEGDQLLGLFGVRDEIKEESKKTVAWLEKRDVEVWMITGDNEATAAAVAKEIGIAPEHVKAGVRPEDKADAVKELQQGGKRIVGMVGDGINDAPALAQADLGIAIGTGTDVAIESSDITLVSGDIKGVRRAVELSRSTYSKIKQNLFWAFVYNTLLVPVAAFGFLIPAMAAGAMALSSVSVVSNSLLLKRRKIA
ncbi:heavy metal translocating P-type ATPase [Persicimonas caeni]|uniref:P-type Cu(+) transporter n=1 Tax=Persicimonas caeni TaxID=2292766 RepID=A0A4Y6PP45_PERCE|nr:heavy metal translocating P-type ATPase [Persicimonas caeni]QDG49879.1 heavy metal translocating P-type ATPase [Persicimonas caeni]QED31100.1 heavy metal translocating P-type ATPase [Persicimonas caeni]